MATLEQLRQIFPDAASDEDAIRRASERFGIDPKSIADEVGYDGGASSKNRERMSASVDNYQSNLYGVVGAGARAVGATGLGTWADRRRDDNAFQANIATARAQDQGAIESYKDIGSLRDAGDYVVGLGIQSAPYMAEAFAGGAAGRALLGGATLGSKVLSGTAGAVAASYPSSVGDILQNQRDQNGGENLGAAAVGGVPYALLNAGLGIEGRLSRASLARNTSKALDNMSGVKGAAARTAGTVAKVGADEGASELGQEFVNQYAGRMAVDPNETFLNPKSEDRFKESFIGGAALGGVFGGLGGGWRRSEAYKPPVNDTPGSSTDLLDSTPTWTTTRGFDARVQPEQGPGPLGDTSPEWTTSPGAAQPRGYSPMDAAGLYPAVDDPAVTTGSRRAPLDVPAVPGRPDLADSMVAGGPSSQVAATDADNAAMMDPGAIVAREQQAAAMRQRAEQKAATDAAAREFAGRKAAAYEELVENGPDGKPMIQLKPQEVVLHHDLTTLKATGQITPEQYTAFAGAFKEALMSNDKKAINAVRKEVEAIKNPKPAAQGITNAQPNVPVPAAVAAGTAVAGGAQPGGSVGNMGRVAADAAQRNAPVASASVPSVRAPGAVGDGAAVAAPVAAPATTPAAPVPVVLKKTKKLQPLPPVEAKSAAPDAAPVAPKAPLTGLRRVPRAEAAKVAAPKPRQVAPAAPTVTKYDNLPDLIDAVAKENGIPQVVADAYMQHKVLDRSLDKVAKDMGVGKSTVGDWVKKLHPLVEDAKLTRLEAGARPATAESTAEHEVAPGAEAAVEGEDTERADGPVEADNAVSAEDASVDETGEEGATAGETDANINIENDGHGKGKTKADSGITPARDKALQKAWDQLNAAMPADQRVQWKDLGESQRGAFDFESSKGAGNARRAHSQITQMANEGVHFTGDNAGKALPHGQTIRTTLEDLQLAPWFAEGQKNLDDAGAGRASEWVSDWRLVPGRHPEMSELADGWFYALIGRSVVVLKPATQHGSAAAAALNFAHEVGHAADMAAHGGVYSTQPELAAGGEVETELRGVWERGPKLMTELLAYPFDVLKYPGMDAAEMRQEVFAKLFELYSHPLTRGMLDAAAPKATRFIQEVYRDISETPVRQIHTLAIAEARRIAFRARLDAADGSGRGRDAQATPGTPATQVRDAGSNVEGPGKVDDTRPRFTRGAALDIPPPVLDGGKGVVQWLKNLTSDKLWRTMPGTLGFLSTEQMADRFSDIPMVKSFSDVMRAMGGLANKIIVQSDRLSSEWKALAKRFGKDANDKFSELLLDATTINAWPDEDLGVGKNKHLDAKDAELIAEHKALQQKYRSLPEPYRNLFHKIVADKAEHRDQKVALLKRGIVESYYPRVDEEPVLSREVIDDAASQKKSERDAFLKKHAQSVLAKDTLTKLWRDLDAHAADFKFLPGPYFPKIRFGDHIVSYKSSSYQAAEQSLKRAEEQLQTLLAADNYQPIAEAERALESVKASIKKSDAASSAAALRRSAEQEAVVQLRKRDAVLQSLLECLGK